MDDYISRQKALECFEWTNTRLGAKHAIASLPGMHYEKNELPEGARKSAEVWCEECNHIEMCRWYPFDGCEFRETSSSSYAKGYNDAKREIALSGEYERAFQRGVESAQRWIPCSERLPEEDEKYLVTKLIFNKIPTVDVCHYASNLHLVDKYDFPEERNGWYAYDIECGYYEEDNVVAWMPLPGPYKKEDICES